MTPLVLTPFVPFRAPQHELLQERRRVGRRPAAPREQREVAATAFGLPPREREAEGAGAARDEEGPVIQN